MPDQDLYQLSRGRPLSRLLPWATEHSRQATIIGVGLLLLGSVLIALPPHSIILGIILGLPSVLILTAVVSGRAPQRWLAVIALFGAIWCLTTLGVGFDRLLLAAAGHVESCRYVNSTEGPEDKYGGFTTAYVVGCPDGTQTFSTGDLVPISNGMIKVRTVAGGLLGVTPAGQSDWGLFFFAVPGPIVLSTLLVVSLRTPRRPAPVTIIGSR